MKGVAFASLSMLLEHSNTFANDNTHILRWISTVIDGSLCIFEYILCYTILNEAIFGVVRVEHLIKVVAPM